MRSRIPNAPSLLRDLADQIEGDRYPTIPEGFKGLYWGVRTNAPPMIANQTNVAGAFILASAQGSAIRGLQNFLKKLFSEEAQSAKFWRHCHQRVYVTELIFYQLEEIAARLVVAEEEKPISNLDILNKHE